MTIKSVFSSKRIVVTLVLLFLVSLLILGGLIYSKKQEVRNLDPDSVLMVFQDAGYHVTNIETNINDYFSPMGDFKGGLEFEIVEDDETYGVFTSSL